MDSPVTERYADSARSQAAATATLTLLSLNLLVLAQGVFAYRADFLTASQMRAAGVSEGMPFIWHFGMWGDFFVVSPLASYLVGRHAHLWSIRRILFSFAIAFAASGFMHWTYTLGSMPGAHVQNHQLTIAGWLHLFYMGLAICVFVMFLLFTPRVSTKVLAVASILLVVHVFAGTHMVLGIFTTLSPQDWYPYRPLRSPSGWLIAAGIGIVLLWRNLKALSDSYGGPRGVLQRLAQTYMYWVSGEVRRVDVMSPHGLLVVLNSLGARTLEFAAFAGAAVKTWYQNECLRGQITGLGATVTCIWRALLPPALVLVFGTVYFLSRRSVKQELYIVEELFPRGRLPQKWAKSKDPWGFTISVFIFFALYVCLAYLAHDIRLVSFIMTLIALIDFNTRRLINNRVAFYFSDRSYAPRPEDADADLIQERRRIISRYLFDRPHLPKEATRIAGCATAFGLAWAGSSLNSQSLTTFGYLVLILTLVTTEVIVHRWRRERDESLDWARENGGEDGRSPLAAKL